MLTKLRQVDINIPIPNQTKADSEFRWSSKGIKNHGIFIPSLLDKLYNTNYDKTIYYYGLFNQMVISAPFPVGSNRIHSYECPPTINLLISNVPYSKNSKLKTL